MLNRNIGALVKAVTALRPVESAAAAAYSLTGVSIEREKHQSATFLVATGAESGTPDARTVDAKLQDSADGSVWADVAVSPTNPAVAIAQITAVNTDKELNIDLSPLRKYVRLVFTVAFTAGTTPKILVGASCVLGGGPIKPA